ncbi:F-box/kelch-repeat protein At3g23880-like [Arachis stenosperma]|uniref:F-box/kelch-repeat protein At3g23880-like n=1 Tax=Arachis stenosperma TaxID=217475 RepID=UPI0025AC9DED|nr:F-box/kelch-repeat protein At3g23880-like [Arachis stenosperma]
MEQPHDYHERNRNPLRITRNAPKRLLPSTVTSSQPLPVLPDELLTEIFLRLPARLLLSVRSVCRSWRTLISSSQFANYHVQRSITADPTLGGLRFVVYHHTCHYSGNFSVRCLFENPSKPTDDALFQISGCHQIIGSCNGLMCLLEKVGTDYRVMLWNPCTGLTSDLLEIRGYTIWASGFGYDHESFHENDSRCFIS